MTIQLLKEPISLKAVAKNSFTNNNHSKTRKKTDYQYNVFVVIWSIAVLFHMANAKIFADGLHFALLTISAFALISKPSSIFRLILYLALHITASLRVMPYVSNHEIFVLFANFTILHALLYYVVKRKSFYINKEELYHTFAPLIRIELIILYFFVVFHKLNSAFLNPDVSCAADFYKEQNTYSFLPSSQTILTLNIYLTLIVESLIPIFLCFRKTRNIGLLVGLIFHLIIAFNPINGFFDFSSAIFAAYVLFMAPSFGITAHQLFFKLRSLKKKLSLQRFSYTNVIMTVLTVLGVILFIYQLSITIADFFRFVFWTGFSLLFIYIFLKSVFSSKTLAAPTISYKWAHASLLLFPLIVLFNGFCPYLGLKTQSSFAMFSNLRTEGGVTNHLIVPIETQIFDFQKDVVEIISSSEAELQKNADRKELLVYFQFKELINYYKPKRVEYLRNGKRHTFTLATASNESEILEGNPFLLQKILRFRNISKYEPQPCAH